jgi:hypothetical protein
LSTHIYQQNIEKYNASLGDLKAFGSKIAWARFACIIVVIFLVVWQWPVFQIIPSLFIVISIAAFLRLVAIAVNNTRKIEHTQHLISINEEELAIASGKFHQRYDGKDFLPTVHDYAQDLDLFGRASLYQYTQRAESEPGRREWAIWLLQSAAPDEMIARQIAAKQLASEIHWRQQLQAIGRISPLSKTVEARLLEWQTFEDANFSKSYWHWIRWIGPIISISILIGYIVGIIPSPFFNAYLLLFFVLSSYTSKLATPAYLKLGKLADEIKTFSASLACIAQMPTGESEWLQQHKKSMQPADEAAAAEIILQLNGILKRMDYRLNPVVFIPLNILLFWDVQQMLQLAKWQEHNAGRLGDWL